MTSKRASPTIRAFANYIGARLLVAGVGVALYFLARGHITIEQQGQISSAFLTVATVIGVVAGFLGAGVFFVAGASGPSIDRIRTQHGQKLNMTLLGAMALLMASAFGAVICGLFSNGFGAKAAMAGIMTLVAFETSALGMTLAVALKSQSEPPIPRRENYPST
ncbi:hypothetical protein [Rhodococcus sp. IEGM 1302]|uniref:hypothetical protein n=1 Tax=Rhodococcus sp. IEGM 1302 TaxID=3047093 RepID=UPI0024B71AFA|nr:hypothetical protein [Rhodococcus sp. IEGM 1302]MDI9947019.1 hypothetical protein [Rhodococcus sp. IEGM 1302]